MSRLDFSVATTVWVTWYALGRGRLVKVRADIFSDQSYAISGCYIFSGGSFSTPQKRLPLSLPARS